MILLSGLFFAASAGALKAETALIQREFPPPLESYGDAEVRSVGQVLQHRAQQEPFNVWATLLFFGAVLHTFCTHKFLHWSHVIDERYRAQG